MKEPVDHILRPRLPWRSEGDTAITECGHDASKVSALTRDQYAQRLAELGQKRCAMLTCMTCSETTTRWLTWDQDPRKALGREIEWETGWHRGDRGCQLKDELQAIAKLIVSHREEFLNLLSDISTRREWLNKKKLSEWK